MPDLFSHDYSYEEMAFMLKKIEMDEFLISRGYSKNKRKSTPHETVFTKGEKDISIRTGRRGFWIWRVLDNGVTPSGTIIELFKHEYDTDQKGAGDKMREYVQGLHGLEFDNFKRDFQRGIVAVTPVAAKVSSAKRVETFNLNDHQKSKAELPPIPAFSFTPATDFEFFASRGIEKATLDSILFRDRFGNQSGPFGTDIAEKSIYKPTDFVYSQHLIVPQWDAEGTIVGLEAKNKLTDAAYTKEVEREMAKEGGRPMKVRRNPAKFYKDGRRGAWISNIPENPEQILLSEQPADSLSYYQLHKNDPLMQQTIFFGTGGNVVPEHYAILILLLQNPKIKKVLLGFDRNISGLMYSLSILQNLPYKNVPGQKLNVEFSTIRNYGVCINFVLKEKLLSITAQDIHRRVESLKRVLTEQFKFDGGFELVPALSLRAHFASVYIPYTPANGEEIFRLTQLILKTPTGFFEFCPPKLGEDWNDELQGLYSAHDAPKPLLLDQPETRNRIYINEDNAILYHQRNLTFDHNIKETIGRVNPFARREFIAIDKNVIGYDFLMDSISTLEAEYLKLMPALNDQFIEAALRQDITYSPITDEFMRGRTVIATWDTKKLSVNEASGAISEYERLALIWMRHSLKNGQDPNSDSMLLRIDYNKLYFDNKLIGSITTWFSIQEKEGVKFATLGDVAFSQIVLLTAALQDVRKKWKLFRELYPEPVKPLSSDNLLFYEDKVPMFKFPPQENVIEFVGDPQKVFKRNFNQFFYKALQLFSENQGIFYNYIRLMRVDYNDGVIFYNRPDQEIGRVVHHEGKYFYALYPNIPGPMKREMEVFCPLPVASAELLEKYGIILEPKGLSAKVKEQRISKIPFAYTRFFDSHEREFITMSEDKLKKMSSNIRTLYTDAYLWHLNNVSSSGAEVATYKDNFYEKNGSIYFNRIPVAQYRSETDTLELIAPPSPKYYRYLAIFERNLVKEPVNRRFAQYFLENPPEQPNDLSYTEEVGKLLDKIEYTEESGEINMVDYNFELKRIGIVKDKVMIIEESYRKYSAIFEEVLSLVANTKHWKLKWEAILPMPSSVQVNLASIEVPVTTKRFKHELRTTEAGALTSLIDVPIFDQRLRLNDHGELEFVFMANSDGLPAFPASTKWKDVDKPLYWMSKKPEKVSTIVLTNDPVQAVLYFQYNLPESLSGRELYVSTVNVSIKDAVATAIPLIQAYSATEVRVIGDSEFTQGVKARIKDTKIFAVPSLTQPHSIARIERYLSGYEGSSDLQLLFESIRGHNFINPAPGIALFPMASETASSSSVLGNGLYLSKDQDALWFSRPLRDSSRIILLSDPEEALYYMYLNRDFIAKDVIISFQRNVTGRQVDLLNEELRLPRFHNRINVANTGRLSEQLMDLRFRHRFEIEKPLKETSFRSGYLAMKERYAQVKREIRLARRRGLPEPSIDLGKTNALAINEAVRSGQENQISAAKMIR